MQGRFNFTGNLGFNSDDSKNPPIRVGKTKNGSEYQTLGASVSSEKNNRGYVECFSMKTATVKTKNAEGNDMEVDFDDRFDEEFVSSARSKHIIRNGEERLEFVSPWDVVEYVKNHKSELNGKLVTITGNINKNIYNGTISDRFQIRNIYILDEESEKSKPGLTLTEEVYFNKDSIDTADWKEEKKLYINGYVETYINKEVGNKLVPRQLVFDCSRIDFENERHVKLVNYKLKQLNLALSDGKIVNNIKSKKTYKALFSISYVNGAEEMEFDESMLTDNQREAIELGINTLDDFKPRSAVYGTKVTLYKIKGIELTGDYADGCIDTELSDSEFEEMLYDITTVGNAEEVLKEEKVEEEDDDDLFK